MKRTMVSFILILVFVLGVVAADLCFMTSYVKGMNASLDELGKATNITEKQEAGEKMFAYFERKRFWAHRFIPTNRIEDLETALFKLHSYLETEDKSEVEATEAEIRARVNLLYSTWLYHWYHPFGFGIE